MYAVEVFKTDVICPQVAKDLICELQGIFPEGEFNFDLEDCDKILRVQSPKINAPEIVRILKTKGFNCAVLV